MILSRNFKETIQARIKRDPDRTPIPLSFVLQGSVSVRFGEAFSSHQEQPKNPSQPDQADEAHHGG